MVPRTRRANENSRSVRVGRSMRDGDATSYLIVFQTQISDSTHWRCLAFGQVLVHLINTIGDVVVGLVEHLASNTNKIKNGGLESRSARANATRTKYTLTVYA